MQLIQSNATQLTATYEVIPLGYMVIHSSLGTEPYFYFNQMKISTQIQSVMFDDLDTIQSLFKPKEENFYQFAVKQDYFD